MRPRVCNADEAVLSIPTGGTLATTGSGGGILEPAAVLAALEQRFLGTGEPRDLTFIHALGLGDRASRGTNALAHEGMTRRVIGGHWTWSPRMIDLARNDRIEAYVFPAGVISTLLRESGARRPGLITRTGVRTFVDPRYGGGRANAAAKEDLVEVVVLDGIDYLRYRPLAVDVGLIRGSVLDSHGNIGSEDEAALLDAFDVALAARGNGGVVIAQVQRVLDTPLDPRTVSIPAAMVDLVVVDPAQSPSYSPHTPAELFGGTRSPVAGPADWKDPATAIIARRAAREVVDGNVLNLGFGISAEVVRALGELGRLDQVRLAIEQGAYDGLPFTGDLFGISQYPTARITSTSQFDVFSAGLLDVCALGMAQIGSGGDVNVSRIAGGLIGPGGFIDISQNARKAVFCGTFTTKGLELSVQGGALEIRSEGSIMKFVDQVDEITYSGGLAVEEGRSAVYVTERAVFELTAEGLELVEIAPGIDLQRDVLDRMGFAPIVRDVRAMPPEIFAGLGAGRRA